MSAGGRAACFSSVDSGRSRRLASSMASASAASRACRRRRSPPRSWRSRAGGCARRASTAAASPRALPSMVAMCRSSVDANAAGDENRRFLSSWSTKCRRPRLRARPASRGSRCTASSSWRASRSSSVYSTVQRFEAPHRVEPLALRVDEIALQPAHHHPGELLLGREDVAREALVVEQLEQRGERLGVAVVRRGGEEQLVLEVRREQADEPRAQALDGVLCRRSGATLWASSTISRSNCAGYVGCGGSTSRRRRMPSPCFTQSIEVMSRGK